MYNKEMETLSREEMQKLQGERLVKTVKHVYENVPAYKAKFDEKGIKPEDIKTVDDLKKLPFTYKQDLRDNYPYDLFAVPMDDVVRIHASSGTTGKQTVVGYTKNDIALWSEVMARTLAGCGATSKDIVHVSYGYGLFTGGLGAHYGSEALGSTTIPVSVGNTQRQIQIMQDFKPTLICCTPSYALYLAETIEQLGIDPATLSLKYGYFGAEPSTQEMRVEIEKRLKLKAYDVFGLSEIIGPGVSFECTEQAGLHVNEDHFIPEIIDPDTEEVLPYGTAGELVFTCITKEALPLIRYRTRDIAVLNEEKCKCGRTLIRMSKPRGRTDDMLIIRGVNVFPSQIESVLLEMGDTAPHYLLVVDRENNTDSLEIVIEMNETNFSDEIKAVEVLRQKIRSKIESTLGISAKISLVEPKSIPRSEGKAQRVKDNRKLID